MDWVPRLGAALPPPLPTSNNHLLPLDKALAFMHGVLCDARKLTHVAHLRRNLLLALAELTYNLTVLFQRHLGWQKKVSIHSFRF